MLSKLVSPVLELEAARTETLVSSSAGVSLASMSDAVTSVHRSSVRAAAVPESPSVSVEGFSTEITGVSLVPSMTMVTVCKVEVSLAATPESSCTLIW
jgi:hypothetical protein